MGKTKLALIRPPYSQSYDRLITVKTKECRAIPPTGLMYLASYAEKGGIEARIYDCEVEGVSEKQFASWLNEFNPDVVGITSVVTDYHLAKEIAKISKNQVDSLVVMGGHFPSAMGKFILNDEESVDVIVRGEGEQSLLEILNKFYRPALFPSIPNLIFREGSKIVETSYSPPVQNLDLLPFPSRDLIDVKKYRYPDPDKGMVQMSALFSSRGCPHSCTFCYKINDNKVRYRSPDNVVDEIEEVVGTYNTEWIMFYDDTFTLYRRRAIAIAKEISERGIDIRWKCQARADTIDEEIIDIMMDAGLSMISIGIEAGNQQVLDGVSKGINLEETRKVCEMLVTKPLTVRASFILGLPWESYQSAQDTIDYATSLPIDLANFSILVPYPGTKVYEQAIRNEGLSLIDNDWQNFRRHGYAVVQTPTLSVNDLMKLQEEALTKFYLHPVRVRYFAEKYLAGNHTKYFYRPFIEALKSM